MTEGKTKLLNAYQHTGDSELVAAEAFGSQQFEECGEEQRVIDRHRELNVPKVTWAVLLWERAGRAATN